MSIGFVRMGSEEHSARPVTAVPSARSFGERPLTGLRRMDGVGGVWSTTDLKDRIVVVKRMRRGVTPRYVVLSHSLHSLRVSIPLLLAGIRESRIYGESKVRVARIVSLSLPSLSILLSHSLCLFLPYNLRPPPTRLTIGPLPPLLACGSVSQGILASPVTTTPLLAILSDFLPPSLHWPLYLCVASWSSPLSRTHHQIHQLHRHNLLRLVLSLCGADELIRLQSKK